MALSLRLALARGVAAGGQGEMAPRCTLGLSCPSSSQLGTEAPLAPARPPGHAHLPKSICSFASEGGLPPVLIGVKEEGGRALCEVGRDKRKSGHQVLF